MLLLSHHRKVLLCISALSKAEQGEENTYKAVLIPSFGFPRRFNGDSLNIYLHFCGIVVF